MNLSDDGEGMVPLNPSTAFKPEKNVNESKETPMDSTPINDIMMEHNQPMMMNDESRMMPPPPPTNNQIQAPTNGQLPGKKNPLNMTDDQMTAIVVAVSTALAVSKPVQDRLATSIPKFLNEQGGRSMVGLATTGLVAAVVFYFVKDYVVKP